MADEVTDNPVPNGDVPPDDSKSEEPKKEPVKDPLEADVTKFLELKKQLGSAEEVAKFLEARGALEKARKEFTALSNPPPLPAPLPKLDPIAVAEKKLGLSGGRSAEADAAAALVAKHNLDNNFTDTSGREVGIIARPAGFGPQYLDQSWGISGENVVNAVTLEPNEWDILLNINKVFHGFRIREEEKDVVKARVPAFEFVRTAGIANEKPVPPEYEVYDSSSISIKEMKTDLQRSLAENGFSSNAMEASVSGGAWGVSAGISTALRKASSSGTATTNVNAEKEYFATYNFPRARIFMDEYTLKISRACEAALNDLKNLEIAPETPAEIPEAPPIEENPDAEPLDPNEERLRKFSEQFGHVYATVFQVGGQLQSSKFASSMLTSKETDHKDALKASVAASFSSMYASGSTKYTNESNSHTETQEQKITDLSTLAWTARGGNTLLCANPPAWAASVGPARNWRQEQVVALHDLIGRFPGYEGIPALFERIAQKKLNEQKARPIGWSGKIKLSIDNKRLAYSRNDTNTIMVTAAAPDDGSEEPVFTVLNANIADNNPFPTVTSLPLDFPLFLVTGSDYERNPDMGYGIPSLWANYYGALKPESTQGNRLCRWSFRRPYSVGRWDFEREDSVMPKFADGDEVALYCHSMNFGMMRGTDYMPYLSARVKYHPGQGKLVVLGMGDPLSEEWDWSREYEVGVLEEGKVKAMYRKDERICDPFGTAYSSSFDPWAVRYRQSLANTEIEWARNGWIPAVFKVHYVK